MATEIEQLLSQIRADPYRARLAAVRRINGCLRGALRILDTAKLRRDFEQAAEMLRAADDEAMRAGCHEWREPLIAEIETRICDAYAATLKAQAAVAGKKGAP